jgi:hypothetical protein
MLQSEWRTGDGTTRRADDREKRRVGRLGELADFGTGVKKEGEGPFVFFTLLFHVKMCYTYSREKFSGGLSQWKNKM